MTRFEQTAINIQMNARYPDWAIAQFSNTCNLCCLRNRRADCSRCMIADTHRQVLAILADNAKKGGK